MQHLKYIAIHLVLVTPLGTMNATSESSWPISWLHHQLEVHVSQRVLQLAQGNVVFLVALGAGLLTSAE